MAPVRSAKYQCAPVTSPTAATTINVPAGGREMLILNAEARIPVPIKKGLGVVAFYDGGNVFPLVGFHQFTSLYSNNVGFGLRYATPVGPIRIDIGRNLNPVPGRERNPILHQHRASILRRPPMATARSYPLRTRTRSRPAAPSAPQAGPYRRMVLDHLDGAYDAALSLIGAILLHNASFHAYVIRTAQQQAQETLGVRVQLQNFALNLSNLSLDIYGVTVDGASPYPNPPLLQLQHAQASVRIVSILQKKWYLNDIRIDHPVVQIYVDKNGHSNIPTVKSSNSNEQHQHLRSRHPPRGAGQRRSVLQRSAHSSHLDLHNVDFHSVFNEAIKQYSGKLAYTDGQRRVRNVPAVRAQS